MLICGAGENLITGVPSSGFADGETTFPQGGRLAGIARIRQIPSSIYSRRV